MSILPDLEAALARIDAPHEILPGGWVFNCDNRLVYEALPDNCIDLIITDPPYKDYQSNRPVAHEKVKKINVADFDLPFFIEQSSRVLKPGAHFYCWCDHLTFPGIVMEMNAQRGRWKMENGTKEPQHYLTYKNMLVWVKNNHGSGDLKGNYAPQHELVIFGVKGDRGRPLNGKRLSNIFDARKVPNHYFNHGTVKPVEILKKFIEASSNEGDVVMDPYAGTMGVGEAVNSGRKFVMVEREKGHWEARNIRLSNKEEKFTC